MDDLQVYVLFNSISVISGLWAGDNERLCAMESCLCLKRLPPHTGLDSRIASSVGLHAVLNPLSYRGSK